MPLAAEETVLAVNSAFQRIRPTTDQLAAPHRNPP